MSLPNYRHAKYSTYGVQTTAATCATLMNCGKENDDNAEVETGSSCGKCGGRVPTNKFLHHPEFNLDEDIMGQNNILSIKKSLGPIL